jgi:hypothetical protein
MMGLDMYAFSVPKEWVGTQEIDYRPDADRKSTELFYWRKFNALHGWMEDLYRFKGGTRADFNCTTVRLNPEDLDRLEMDTGNNKLVPRTGFFFGSQDIYPEDLESVSEFVAKAREAITEGKAVFYDSWW